MHEVAEGSWGAGGQIIQFKQLAEIAKREREGAEAGGAGRRLSHMRLSAAEAAGLRPRVPPTPANPISYP